MKTAESIDTIIHHEQRRLGTQAFSTAHGAFDEGAANGAMDRFAVGEDEAFGTLYQTLAPRIYRYLLRRTQDVARAEDLTQQTMLQIHRKRALFARGAEVGPWAFTIARRFLIDSARKQRRETAGRESLLRSEPVAQPAGDEMLRAKELAHAIARELARLPLQQRVAFQMIKLDGLSVREVATQLGTSVNAVKLRAHRAYLALRASVDGDDVGQAA